MLGVDVEADVLLRDALDGRRKGGEVVDVLRVGENGRGERLELGAGLAVVGLVEEVADLLILEHALIHAPGDRQSMLLEGRNGGFDEMNGRVAE